MRREHLAGALLALAAIKPVWSLARRLKRAWDLSHLPVIVLRGANGLEVHVSPLGCVIQRLLVPDQQGNLDDIVLGFDDLRPYAVAYLLAYPPPFLCSEQRPFRSTNLGTKRHISVQLCTCHRSPAVHTLAQSLAAARTE